MAVSVSIELERVDLSQIRRALDMGTDAHRRRLALAAGRGMTPYVPMRTGALTGSVQPGVGEVTYRGTNRGFDYASFVFDPSRPIRIHKDRHPKATSRWDRKYSDDGAKEVCEEVLRIVNGH